MFDIEITGLGQFQRELASQAFQALDGELGTLSFDPNDPASIDRALREMEAAIDANTHFIIRSG